jgi:serine protein kinase
MATATAILDTLRTHLDTSEYKRLHWEGSFSDYLNIVLEHPGVTRTAYQRLYDMILSHGVEDVYENKDKLPGSSSSPSSPASHADGIYGLDRSLIQLVNTFKSAALGYGTERRVILLHGRSAAPRRTIARSSSGDRGVQPTDAGMLFSFSWKNPDGTWSKDPMHGEPLQLVPGRVPAAAAGHDQRAVRQASGLRGPGSRGTSARTAGTSTRPGWPSTRRLAGDAPGTRSRCTGWSCPRRTGSGIGTFQPKDEKNQDSTELTGDINYRKIAEYGSDSDPRAFNFDGELNIGNRGIVEFIEVLKLDVAFLYDLSGASQEHKIKPKKFAQTDIDEVILGHTNEPEYSGSRTTSSWRPCATGRSRSTSRTSPGCGTRCGSTRRTTARQGEGQAHRPAHGRGGGDVGGADAAEPAQAREPERAAEDEAVQRQDAAGVHRGQRHRAEARRPARGHARHQPAVHPGQDSNALVAHPNEDNINPFMVMKELEDGLRNHSLIKDEDQFRHFKELLSVVREEYEDIVKNEVQRAIAADEDALIRLCGNYMDNVRAYTQREKVRNRYTGSYEEPDERLMRASRRRSTSRRAARTTSAGRS